MKALKDNGLKAGFIGEESMELIHLIEMRESRRIVCRGSADPCRFLNTLAHETFNCSKRLNTPYYEMCRI